MPSPSGDLLFLVCRQSVCFDHLIKILNGSFPAPEDGVPRFKHPCRLIMGGWIDPGGVQHVPYRAFKEADFGVNRRFGFAGAFSLTLKPSYQPVS